MKRRVWFFGIMALALLVMVPAGLSAQSVANTFYAGDSSPLAFHSSGMQRFRVIEFTETTYIMYDVSYGHTASGKQGLLSQDTPHNEPKKIIEGTYTQSGNKVTLIDDFDQEIVVTINANNTLTFDDKTRLNQMWDKIEGVMTFTKVPGLDISKFPASLLRRS